MSIKDGEIKSCSKEKGKVPSLFKVCPTCGHIWQSRNDFIMSDDVNIVGYQSNISDIEKGMFLFNHNVENCGSTIALRVRDFMDLYTGPTFLQPKVGTGECEKRCLEYSDIERCNANCRHAYIREIIQFLRKAM